MGAHGQIRRGQVITTYGPGALIDLPNDSAIVAGLETWGKISNLTEIVEPRLTRKIQAMTGITQPKLYEPPAESQDSGDNERGISAYRFPEWFVVMERDDNRDESRERSRRLVHRRFLDKKGRFDGLRVVATRFVRACVKGHVDDLDWYSFVHGDLDNCRRQLWLDERGTSGDLVDLSVRCECGKSRSLSHATQSGALGSCRGKRPWLGRVADETCDKQARLLIRTASNAYFGQVISVLSLPDRGNEVVNVVRQVWDDLQIVSELAHLTFLKMKPNIASALHGIPDTEVLEAIQKLKGNKTSDAPVKLVELDALLAAPEGFGDDVPVDRDFHARRLPERVWRHSSLTDGVEAVIQVHRLREVLALVGFTRFEAVTPDINGEYDTDVERADIALDPAWFPAVENRGEGIFLQLRSSAVTAWLSRPGVQNRLQALENGHKRWAKDRKGARPFVGGPYILLHSLSHLLLQTLAMRCGYPASSIRERIYVNSSGGQYGILLYTGSPDSEGTLGGLVQQARHIEDHLTQALRLSGLCSNDPICAQHQPDDGLEERWLLGSACHGCALIAETSCEMRNDHLDRALVVPVLGVPDAAFFEAIT